MNEKTGLKQNRNVTLDYLRVFAMFLILFDHLGLMRNPQWFLGSFVSKIFAKPLYIIEDFGKLAVCLFFLLTGYFFVPSLNRAKSRISFVLKRFTVLYIPTVLMTALFFVFQRILGSIFGSATFFFQFSPRQWLESGTLLGFFNGGCTFNAALWYLIPTMLFIALASFVYCTTVRGGAVMQNTILFSVILILFFIGKKVNFAPISVLCRYAWYLPQIMVGTTFYFVRTKAVSKGAGVIMTVISYLIIILGLQLFRLNYYIPTPYMPSFLYALLIFVVALKIDLKPNKVITFLASISFCVYLNHFLFGALVASIFEQLPNKIHYSYIFIFSTLTSLAVGTVLHLLIEKPIRKLLRRL